MGCWNDKDPRAFPEMLDNKLFPPDVIPVCMKLARDKGHDLFALQSGGECWGGPEGTYYKKHGISAKCGASGLGGSWSNHVYRIKGGTLFNGNLTKQMKNCNNTQTETN